MKITPLHGSLLPLRLGTARNKISHWTTVVRYDLQPLSIQVDDLNQGFQQLKEFVNNSNNTVIIQSFQSVLQNTENLLKQVNSGEHQLVPLIRKPRGALNFIGSIIKAISGNLDAEDAEKYDKVIQALTNNQEILTKNVAAQIHLAQTTLQNYEHNLQVLKQNQEKVNKRLNDITNYLQQENTRQNSYNLLDKLHTSLYVSMNSILILIERLSEAKTFAKLEAYHPTIIPAEELINELQIIQTSVSNQEIPLKPSMENIYTIEKTISVKAYIKGYILTFLLEIPLVEPTTYQYYQLIPLPVKENTTYLILNIPKLYLAENKDRYINVATKCKEIQQEEFLCKATSRDAAEHPICGHQLIRHLPITACSYTKWSSLDVKMIHPTESEWILFQANSTAEIKCNDRQEVRLLQGNLFLQMTPECSIHLGHEYLQTTSHQAPAREFHLNPVNLSTIKEDQPYWKLDDLRLQDLQMTAINTTKNKLAQLDSELRELTKIQVNHFWGSTTIVTISILTIFTISGFGLWHLRRRKPSRMPTQAQEQVPNPWLAPRGEELHPAQSGH